MNNLFDKSDVLTVITAEQAKVGDRGYFGNSWLDLQEAIKNNYLASISTIFTGRCDCFMNDAENTIYGLFLPLDKVKNKAIYRPLRTFDELFNFLIPDIDVDCSTFEKVKCILCRMYELRSKLTGNICYRCFSQICLTEEGDIILDARDLEHFFKNYEIKKDGEFVSFGKLEE